MYTDKFEYGFITIDSDASDFLIVACYRPPQSEFNLTFNEIQNLFNKISTFFPKMY